GERVGDGSIRSSVAAPVPSPRPPAGFTRGRPVRAADGCGGRSRQRSNRLRAAFQPDSDTGVQPSARGLEAVSGRVPASVEIGAGTMGTRADWTEQRERSRARRGARKIVGWL